MVKVVVLYAEAPEPEPYAGHAELCRRVEGATFRHGSIFGAPTKSAYRYYAEWEFADRAAFDRAAASREFAATGNDALELGVRFEVLFADAG
jgi:hypothetical protein